MNSSSSSNNNSSTGDKFHFRREQAVVDSTSVQAIDHYANNSSSTDLLQQQSQRTNNLSSRFTTRKGGDRSPTGCDYPSTGKFVAQSAWRTTEPNPFPPTPPPPPAPPTQRSSSFRRFLNANLKRSLVRINGHRRQNHQHKFNDSRDAAAKSPSSSSSRASQLIKMARKRYLLTLTCFTTIFLAACLLGSLVFSRSIGSGGDLDSDSGGQSAAQLMAGRSGGGGDQVTPPPEVFEVRAFELIDLIECDKSFAYTKWLVRVRVRKSAPAYEQHNLQAAVSSGKLASVVEGGESKPEVATIGDDQYQLTGTRTFVADHQQAGAAAGASSDSQESIIDEFQGDPIEVAASGLEVEASAFNSTLIDCFIVDTDKRYGQKLAIEARHKRLASTRRVGFKKMLATITACRLLSWTELSSSSSSRDERNSSQSLLLPAAQRHDRITKRADQTNTTSRVSFLNQVIKPVERPPPPPVSSSQSAGNLDPLNSLIGALVTWSRQPANNSNSSSSSNNNDTTKTTTSNRPAAKSISEEEEAARRASYFNMGMSMVSGIVPNTLWCGLGDRAANYSELGAEFMVDACCRAHDHCPIRLKPFTTDYGLINWSMSTRSHCDCDLDFSNCLAAINSTLSNVIKTLYFRFVGLQCIDLSNGKQKLTSTTTTTANI